MARIEELTREAVSLPKEQRLALARALLDLEPAGGVAEVEESWDEEIRARIKAVDEGQVTGIAYEDLRREMNSRYGA
jgi:putative addiction module component (TIGR02574 family)